MIAALLWPALAGADTLSAGDAQAVEPVSSFVPAVAELGDTAWNGTEWLVTYFGGRSLVGVRVAADGSIVDQPGFLIASLTQYGVYGALATRGSDYVAAWGEWQDGQPFSVRLRSIGSDGALGDELTVGTVDPMPERRPLVDIASGAGSELIVWCEEPVYGGIGICHWAKVVDTVVATGSIELPTGVDHLEVEASGADWLVAVGTYGWDVLAFRVGSDGQALDDVPFEIAASIDLELMPLVAPAADGWGLVFTQEDVLHAATVSAAGVVDIKAGDLGGYPISASVLEPTADGYALLGNGNNALALMGRFLNPALEPTSEWLKFNDYGGFLAADWGDDALLVTWGSTIGEQILTPRANRFGADGLVLDDEPLYPAIAPINQTGPLVARGSKASLVVWHETRPGMPTAIYGQLLDDAAAPVLVEPMTVVAENSSYATGLALAASPCGWLTVWFDSESPQLRAKRIDNAGVPLDDEPIDLGPYGGGAVEAIFDGTRWVVGYVGWDYTTQTGTAAITRISAEGELVDGGPIVVSGDVDVEVASVQVEADEEGYLVSWHPPDGGIVMGRVDPSGIVVAGEPSTLLAASTTTISHTVDYRGGDGWLVWLHSSMEQGYYAGFQNLGADLPPETFDDPFGFDLGIMRNRARFAYTGEQDPSRLSFWLASKDTPLEHKLDLDFPGALLSSHRLAVRSGLSALVAFQSHERFGGAESSRIKAMPLTRTTAPVVDALDAHNLLGACAPVAGGGDGGSAGDAGTSDAGAGGRGASNTGGGDAGAGDARGGDESASGGASTPSGDEGGVGEVGGAATDTSGDRDRFSKGCGCRTIGQSSHAPWLLMALIATGFVRRRRR